MTAAELLNKVHTANEILQLEDGFYYYWPRKAGAFDSWQLRTIAAELNRLNKPAKQELRREMAIARKKAARVAAGRVSFTPDSEEILLARDVGKLLGLPEPSVYLLVHKGKIPFFKLGRYIRFNKSDVLAWITNRKEATS
jgi:excisionase family DNA binding protein